MMLAAWILGATLTASTPSPMPTPQSAPTPTVTATPAPPAPAPRTPPVHWHSTWAGDVQVGVGGAFDAERAGVAGDLRAQVVRMSQLGTRPAGGFFLEGLASPGRRPEAGGGVSLDFALAWKHQLRLGPAAGVLAGPDGTDGVAAIELGDRVPIGNPGYNDAFAMTSIRVEERQSLRHPSDRATIATLQFSFADSIACFAWRFVPSE